MPGEKLQSADIHEIVVVVNRRVAPVPVEDARVVSEKLFLFRPQVGQGLAPDLNADLSLWRNGAGRQTSFDDEELGVRRNLLQSKRRFPLADLNVRLGELMPVNEDIGGRKRGPAGRNPIAVFEIAFNFEIEVLGKVSD